MYKPIPAIKTADNIGNISILPPLTKGVITTMAMTILVIPKISLPSSFRVSFFIT